MTKPIIGIGSDVVHPPKPGERDRAFTYMTYIDALRRAGAVPVLIPPQPENVKDVVDGLDGVLLAGGDDCDPRIFGEEPHPSCETMDPRRQDNDLALAGAARAQRVPTLGICLGLQVMNVAAGGTLIQDIDSHLSTDINHVSPPSNRARHQVEIRPGTFLSEILPSGEYDVNSSHHQAVRDPGQGLRITAQAPDGIIEGLEDPKHPFYVGVQWHPEDMGGETSATRLFGAFVEAARKRAEARRSEETDPSPVGAGRPE